MNFFSILGLLRPAEGKTDDKFEFTTIGQAITVIVSHNFGLA